MQTIQTETHQRLLVVAFHLLALLLLGLHLYVATLPPTPTPLPTPEDPESVWWGLWPITYVPSWALWSGTGIVLATLAWSVDQVRRRRVWGKPRRLPQTWLLGSALLLFVGFWLLPIVHTRWGDAYILANAVGWPDPAMRLTHSWQAPLDVYLHSRIWHWLHGPLGWADAVPVYRLLSPIAGALYLLVVLALSRDERLAPNWLTFGLLTSIGVIQLFFGYVENYSFAAAGILAYLWLGLDVLRGERPLWLAATTLAVTNAFHPSTVAYAPSLLYLGWQVAGGRWQVAGSAGHAQPASRPSPLATLLQIALPMFLVAGGTILLMEVGGHGIAMLLSDDRPGGGDGRWLVPLFATTTRWERYTMVSWPHLRDILNQQLLVAPVVLPALLLGAVETIGTIWQRIRSVQGAVRRTSQARLLPGMPPIFLFLLWAAGCHLLLTWVWNPDYGGQRDWDLFSLAAIPATLLLIWVLPRLLPHGRLRRAGAVPLLVLQALHTAAWIYQNRLPWEWPAG